MKGVDDYGSAMLMRGKSLTCRHGSPKIHAVMTAPGRRPGCRRESRAGKSKTCRASAWPSHYEEPFSHDDAGPTVSEGGSYNLILMW